MMTRFSCWHSFNIAPQTGGHAAAALHHARTVCRRAERRVSALQDDLEHAVLAYLNRLSDFLFVAARFAAHKSGAQDVIYKVCILSVDVHSLHFLP